MIIGKEKSSYSLYVLVWVTLEVEAKKRIWVQVMSLAGGSNISREIETEMEGSQ